MIKSLLAAPDLPHLNELLTQLMAERRLQGVLADGGLELILGRIGQLAVAGAAVEKMMGVASLARLAAVARGSQQLILSKAVDLVPERPAPLNSLGSADERFYFASCLSAIPGDWVLPYCIDQAITEETSEKTRSELLKIALAQANDVSMMLSMLTTPISQLEISSEGRLKRARRILVTLHAQLSIKDHNCGDDIGKSITSLAKAVFKNTKPVAVSDLSQDVFDGLLELALAAIRSRFSLALKPETFDVLRVLRRLVDRSSWRQYLNTSPAVSRARICLLESSLILARQNKTDNTFMGLLVIVYVDRGFLRSPMEKYFEHATDIELDVRTWWISLGKSSVGEQEIEQKLDINVDHQIGALLIEIEAAGDAMDKLVSDIVPMLEISDPILAPTMKKAYGNYNEVSRVTRQLAKMRRLELVRDTGKILEYNPSQHEMIGGHRSGIRNVRVIRDGVQKDFGGRVKTILKSWVESID
jgi:hypothetical protein